MFSHLYAAGKITSQVKNQIHYSHFICFSSSVSSVVWTETRSKCWAMFPDSSVDAEGQRSLSLVASLPVSPSSHRSQFIHTHACLLSALICLVVPRSPSPEFYSLQGLFFPDHSVVTALFKNVGLLFIRWESRLICMPFRILPAWRPVHFSSFSFKLIDIFKAVLGLWKNECKFRVFSYNPSPPLLPASQVPLLLTFCLNIFYSGWACIDTWLLTQSLVY